MKTTDLIGLSNGIVSQSERDEKKSNRIRREFGLTHGTAKKATKKKRKKGNRN